MSRNLPILLGVFVVMALSNAVVPVLPAFAGGAAMQGAVYAAYFLVRLSRCSRQGWQATGSAACRSSVPGFS